MSEVSPREYAFRRGKHLSGVYAAIWSGKIPARKRGNRWLIALDADGKPQARRLRSQPAKGAAGVQEQPVAATA